LIQTRKVHYLGATVRDRVTDELRERILTARLLPGERLDLNELSAEFGTSRTPVREAILALEHDGLAKMAPRSGAVVVGLTAHDIQDNFALMAVLAGVAAMWASQRATDADRLRLQELAKGVEQAAKQGHDVAERNLEFHRHINLCARSERLLCMLRTSRRRVPQTFFDVIPEQVDHSIVEHDELLRAILERRGDDARRIAERHFLAAGELLANKYMSLMPPGVNRPADGDGSIIGRS
jgi:DNA-binding GntR family transcriptional regulator